MKLRYLRYGIMAIFPLAAAVLLWAVLPEQDAPAIPIRNGLFNALAILLTGNDRAKLVTDHRHRFTIVFRFLL